MVIAEKEDGEVPNTTKIWAVRKKKKEWRDLNWLRGAEGNCNSLLI